MAGEEALCLRVGNRLVGVELATPGSRQPRDAAARVVGMRCRLDQAGSAFLGARGP
jgi:hypothetical protein